MTTENAPVTRPSQEPITMKCSVCRRTFTGDSRYLRETIWPHADTHKRRPTFTGSFVLSCNCGECEFCAARLPEEPR